MTNAQEDTIDIGATVSIQVWVAGADIDQAEERRQTVDRHMDRLSVRHAGGGFDRLSYDLWRAQYGTDPLASEGDCIADSEYHFAARTLAQGDLATHADEIIEDLRDALDFPVAVNVEIVEQDEFGTKDNASSKHGTDPGAKMLVVRADAHENSAPPGGWSEFEERFGGVVLWDPRTGLASNDSRSGDMLWEREPDTHDIHHIWTVVEDTGSDAEYVVPGVRRLNRVGYIVAVRPRIGDLDDYRCYMFEE